MARQTKEKEDLEKCQAFMSAMENMASGLADYGSNFGGRSWMNDSVDHQEVSSICKDAVKKLREGFVRLSEAEDILERAVPQKNPSRIRRLFLTN